jgi:SNF2 family DNA or RNA helicase
MNELYPFQRAGVDWLKLNRNALLADQPGLGKTIQALTAAAELGCEDILVVCPAVAKAHWRAHFDTWHPATRNVIIVTYDKLSRDAATVKKLKDKAWDLLILDEAHYIKTKTAKRTKAVYGPANKLTGGIAASAARVWLLTGTPSPNHAGELWTHMRALWPNLIWNTAKQPMNEYEFQNRFCKVKDTHFGRQIIGSANLKELRSRLAPTILRRVKTQVLPDLPPLVFRLLPVDPPDYMPDDVPSEMPDGMDGDELLAWIKANTVALAAERRRTGLLKAEIACEWIDNELKDNRRKLIVFAWHRDVLSRIFDRMTTYKPVLIDGSTSEIERPKNIDTFQTDPTCRLFIGQIKACGVAITLTAASDVLFVEQDWTPENNYQAACRAHRIGQKDGVLAQAMYLNNSVDERVQRALVRKQNDLTKLYEKEPDHA